MQKLNHLGVERRHDLVGSFHECDFQPGMAELLGHFDADESAADHDGCLRVIGKRLDPVRVRNGPERVDERRVDAGDARTDRGGPCGDHEFVVGLLVFGSVASADRDRFSRTVNGHRLAFRADVDVEFAPHLFHCLDEQRVAAADRSADIVGEAAVGVGNILPALKKDDLSLFIQASEPCRAGRPAGNAADNYRFHRFLLFHSYL